VAVKPSMTSYRHVQRIKRPDGGDYFYHRLSRMRVLGQPGTPEFEESYRFACDGHKTQSGRRLAASMSERISRGELRPTHVYFVEAVDSGLIKIGSAMNVEERLQKLQTGSSSALRLRKVVPDTSGFFLERLFHRRWADCRIRGEWFKPDDDMVRFIESP